MATSKKPAAPAPSKADAADKPSRRNLSQQAVPAFALDEALRVAQTLYSQFAGDPTAPHRVATALDLSPNSGHWRMISGAAVAYGLVEGGAQADKIALTPLGLRIVAPTEEGDDKRALSEAALKPTVLLGFFKKYNGKSLPTDAIARNVLEHEFNVPRDRVGVALGMILGTGRAVGFIEKTKTGEFVALDGPLTAHGRGTSPGVMSNDRLSDDEEADENAETASTTNAAVLPRLDSQPPASAAPKSKPGILFVGHGKNHAALEQLEKLLKAYSVPYRVAEQEANLARPIPVKVRAVMDECTAAILLFTKDEKFVNENGEEVWLPSQNVVFELGAASFAYEDRIVIFKEQGINFPTNFESIGRIEFESGNLSAKGAELLQELIGFQILKLSVAGAD